MRIKRQFERSGANGKLGQSVGLADAALPFDKQPGESSELDLLTVREAAAFLTISVASTRNLQHARRIPFFKVGGSVRFAKMDLVSYLVQQRIGSLGQ